MNGDVPGGQDNAVHFQERVTALAAQVDEGYGQSLLEQLMKRLDLTAREFEAEIANLVERLRHNAATREELLDRVRQQHADQLDAGEAGLAGHEDDVPEWERRLAELEGSDE